MSPPTETRTPAVVRREIEELRHEVANSAIELRQLVRGMADWRGWVRRSPVGFTVAAAAIGFWFGNRPARR